MDDRWPHDKWEEEHGPRKHSRTQSTRSRSPRRTQQQWPQQQQQQVESKRPSQAQSQPNQLLDEKARMTAEAMIAWATSVDERSTKLVCSYHEDFNTVFQNAKWMAASRIQGCRLEEAFCPPPGGHENWGHNSWETQHVKVKGLAAAGRAGNKEKRERSVALSVVLTAAVRKIQAISEEELRCVGPRLALLFEVAKCKFRDLPAEKATRAGLAAGYASADEAPGQPSGVESVTEIDDLSDMEWLQWHHDDDGLTLSCRYTTKFAGLFEGATAAFRKFVGPEEREVRYISLPQSMKDVHAGITAQGAALINGPVDGLKVAGVARREHRRTMAVMLALVLAMVFSYEDEGPRDQLQKHWPMYARFRPKLDRWLRQHPAPLLPFGRT